MFRVTRLVVPLALSLALSGCVGLGAWTLGSRTESSNTPTISQARGSVDVHKVGRDGDMTTGVELRAHWGEPDRVMPLDAGKEEWIYKTKGWRWSGVVLYVIVIPLPAMIPVGTQYVSFIMNHEQIETATHADWTFKAGAYCGFFGFMNGGWGCGTGTFEQ